MPQQPVGRDDQQTYPFVMIPKVFTTRLKPSLNALAVYYAIKFFAASSTTATSIQKLAALVSISESSFRRGLAELEKKKAVRVRSRWEKLPGGKRKQVPNLYEIIDLQPRPDDKAADL